MAEHEYKDPKAKLFNDINPNANRMMQLLHQLEPGDKYQTAKLLSDLINANQLVDIPVELQSIPNASEFESKSIEFVLRRMVSAGNLETFKDSTRTVATEGYNIYHQGMTRKHTEEIFERFCSILLGYSYPFTADKRPENQGLNINLIIPFLHRYLDQIITKQKRDAKILDTDTQFLKSPLIQHIFHLSEDNTVMASTAIINLYSHWETKDYESLNNEIIRLLVPVRYSHLSPTEMLKQKSDAALKDLNVWNDIQSYLEGYTRFHARYGARMHDAGELSTKDKSVKPEVYITSRIDSNYDPDEANYEQEVVVTV